MKKTKDKKIIFIAIDCSVLKAKSIIIKAEKMGLFQRKQTQGH